MKFMLITMLIAFGLIGCQTQETAQTMSSATALKKIRYHDEAEIEKLRQAGAEIVVKQPGYVIVRTNKMVGALTADTEPVAEQDFVQRLVSVQLRDRSELQAVVDAGVDLWEVGADSVVARAFDLQIASLQQQGYTIHILAEDASKWEENQ